MAVVQFTVAPLGTNDTSLSQFVADIHKLLPNTGLEYQLTPMGTVLEGPLDKIMAVISQMHEVPFEKGAQRVMTLINIDDRRDKKGSIKAKLASVEAKL